MQKSAQGGIAALIEVKHLVKRYGDFEAVRDVSFTVEKGRIYGFLGPNGAGKSTTMNIITGCLAATEGEVTICGYDIYEDPVEAKSCIGYLPEIPPLYVDMTVEETITALRLIALSLSAYSLSLEIQNLYVLPSVPYSILSMFILPQFPAKNNHGQYVLYNNFLHLFDS